MRDAEPVSENEFFDALRGTDPLSAVLRAHIHLEARVYRVIRAFVPHPRHLPNLCYKQYVKLAVALGLTEDALKPLITLGDIRNQFGHRLDANLTDGSVTNLWNGFTPDHQTEVRRVYLHVQQQEMQRWPQKVEDAPPQLRFVIIAMSLDKMLQLA